MVHRSVIGRCTLNGIFTCILCHDFFVFQDQIIKMNLQTESYFFFSNNFKIFVIDSLISYFHIV